MAFGVLLIIIAAILAALFPNLINLVINKQVALKEGNKAFDWWRAPPVSPQMHVYIYNVTNADEFLNNGEKPALQELGPYVYIETWEKVDVTFNKNDTVSYRPKKEFIFSPVSHFCMYCILVLIVNSRTPLRQQIQRLLRGY